MGVPEQTSYPDRERETAKLRWRARHVKPQVRSDGCTASCEVEFGGKLGHAVMLHEGRRSPWTAF